MTDDKLFLPYFNEYQRWGRVTPKYNLTGYNLQVSLKQMYLNTIYKLQM